MKKVLQKKQSKMRSNKHSKLNLNGKWHYVQDAEERFNISEIENLFKSGKVRDTMDIPVNWEIAGLHNFNGSVWFLKEFEFGVKQKGIARLNFLGVDYITDVWLNRKYLGKHEGYFAPFYFNVSSCLRKKNIIIVRVRSPFEIPGEVWPDRKKLIKGIFNHHDCRPGGTSKKNGQDQNTGGIWNDVFIQYGYNIVIDNVKITTSLNDQQDKAGLFVELNYFSKENLPKNISLAFEVKSPAKKFIRENESFLSLPGENKISFYLEINSPLLWWSWDLGKANLYNLKIISDEFETKECSFGIREVKLDDKQQFFINGKKLFLRGTNLIPTQFLSDLDKTKIKKIVSLMKEANINIVRVHAHVNRKELYEECDSQGILVWQDFSLQWTYDESSSFKIEAARQIKEMVLHLYNHPSIAVWCCHNEPGGQIKTLDPLLEQAAASEDSTRIIRRASNYEEHAYEGWYWGKKEYYASTPMGPLVTEFGAQALPGLKSLKRFIKEEDLFPPNWRAWEYHNFQVDQTFNIAKIEIGNSIEEFINNSQQYQSDVLYTAINFYRRKRFNGITGIFQFMFIDCWESITWSVVDFYGKKKKAFYVLKSCYQPVYVSGNLWQDQYFAGRKILLDLYLINDLHKNFENCTIKFYINKVAVGSIKRLSLPANQIIFIKHESVDLSVPKKLSAGKYDTVLKLTDKNGKILSTNYFSFNVVERIR